MATVIDHATDSRFEGVSGTELDYYRGEAHNDPQRYEIVEDDEVSFPQVVADSTASGEQSGGDGTDGGATSEVSPFVLPDGQYLANDGVVYDQDGTRVDPQPSAEQLAELSQH